MEKVGVKLSANSYDVIIGAGLLGQAGNLLKELGFSAKAVIMTDSKVRKLYGEALKQNLTDIYTCTTVEIESLWKFAAR